jgi:hypothetical protein
MIPQPYLLAFASVCISLSAASLLFMTMRLSRIVDALLEINNRTTILPARQSSGGQRKSVSDMTGYRREFLRLPRTSL